MGKERDTMEDKLTLSVEETAKLLGIGRNLCYDRVKTGEIPVIKIGRQAISAPFGIGEIARQP